MGGTRHPGVRSGGRLRIRVPNWPQAAGVAAVWLVHSHDARGRRGRVRYWYTGTPTASAGLLSQRDVCKFLVSVLLYSSPRPVSDYSVPVWSDARTRTFGRERGHGLRYAPVTAPRLQKGAYKRSHAQALNVSTSRQTDAFLVPHADIPRMPDSIDPPNHEAQTCRERTRSCPCGAVSGMPHSASLGPS